MRCNGTFDVGFADCNWSCYKTIDFYAPLGLVTFTCEPADDFSGDDFHAARAKLTLCALAIQFDLVSIRIADINGKAVVLLHRFFGRIESAE